MKIRPIKSEEQYDEALERIYNLMQQDIESGSAHADELEVLSLLVSDYEASHYPIPHPNPLEAIKFRMEQMNMNESELAKVLGYRSRKSEILSGKRKLSLTMIRKIHELMAIPADVLIQPY
jgi:HTH-type transcriptional regulator/antitoxin HigA